MVEFGFKIAVRAETRGKAADLLDAALSSNPDRRKVFRWSVPAMNCKRHDGVLDQWPQFTHCPFCGVYLRG